jgi:antitoxin ParD1/3/4
VTHLRVRVESLTLAHANTFSDFNFRSSCSATVSKESPVQADFWWRPAQTLLNSVIEESAMNVSLTPELERFVDAKVESGLYNNASEVVREGLRLLKEQDEIRVRWREQIERGWLDAQTGRVVDGAAAMTRIKQRLTTRSKKGA